MSINSAAYREPNTVLLFEDAVWISRFREDPECLVNPYRNKWVATAMTVKCALEWGERVVRLWVNRRNI